MSHHMSRSGVFGVHVGVERPTGSVREEQPREVAGGGGRDRVGADHSVDYRQGVVDLAEDQGRVTNHEDLVLGTEGLEMAPSNALWAEVKRSAMTVAPVYAT